MPVVGFRGGPSSPTEVVKFSTCASFNLTQHPPGFLLAPRFSAEVSHSIRPGAEMCLFQCLAPLSSLFALSFVAASNDLVFVCWALKYSVSTNEYSCPPQKATLGFSTVGQRYYWMWAAEVWGGGAVVNGCRLGCSSPAGTGARQAD